MRFDKIFQKIFGAFPPPEFLDIPFAGLAISDTSIHCIQFGRKGGELYIEKYAQRDIPLGVIASGQINNKEALVALLSGLKKDLNLNYVKVSLPEEKAYLFTAKIPIVKSDEVVSAIESKIEENVPVSGGDLCFDYKLIPHLEKGHLDIVVSAIPTDVTGMYVEMATLSGLSLLSLEIESQAITRALIPSNAKGTTLIVNFVTSKVGLYVASDRIVRFTSTTNISLDDLKNPSFLSREISKLYIYWHTLKENVDKPEKKINQIILCGKDLEEDLVQSLSASHHSPANLGNVWVNAFNVADRVPEISFTDSLQYAAAVGLALPASLLLQDPFKK